MDKMERDRKKEARKVHKVSEFAQKSFGLKNMTTIKTRRRNSVILLPKKKQKTGLEL